MAPMPFGTLLCRRLTDSPSEKDDLPATSSSSHMPVTSAAERRHSCSQVGSQNLFSFRHFLNSQSPNPEPSMKITHVSRRICSVFSLAVA